MGDNDEDQTAGPKSLFDRLNHDLQHDPKIQEDLALGRRVGLYRIKKKLGAGNFAQVKLGIHLLTNEKVAIKIIEKAKLDDQSRQLLSSEVVCMERLLHPNTIRLFEVIETYPKLHLVMEVASGGCLMDRLLKVGKFTEDEARGIFSQVVAAVSHMHDCHVVHRDLKAENIFFSSDNQVKVGDFGFSALASPTDTLDTFCGSPPYAAPELFQEEHYLGPPVDVWAIGVLLYYMVSGKLPFSGDSIPELREKILIAEFYMPRSIMSACQDLIAGMMVKEVGTRFSMKDVASSEWMKPSDQPTATTSYQQQDTLDSDILCQLSELGVPTDDHELLRGEPRCSAAGAYRIILHGRLAQPLVPSSDPEPAGDKNKRSSCDKKQKSKFCIIL